MLNIAIIGCGLIGRKRSLAAQSLGLRVSYCYDIVIDNAKKLAFDLNTKYVDDVEVIFKDQNIDAVFISTTHNSLSELTIKSLQANKHVLVEKPAGINIQELVRIKDLATTKKLWVKVGYNYRFHPAILKAKEIISQNGIGELLYIRGRHGHGARLGYEKEWRCNKSLSGGGELLDQGSHLIDLSNVFLKDLNVKFSSAQTLFWDINVEDNCFLALQNDKKQTAWLHVSWTEWKNLFSFEIFGQEGKIDINGLGGSYGVEKLSLYKMTENMGPPETTIWEYPQKDVSWDKEIEEFFAAIKNNKKPDGDIEDALHSWEIINEVYKS